MPAPGGLCVLPLADATTTFPLQGAVTMPEDALDWAHWGPVIAPDAPLDSQRERGPWYADRKRGGLGVLNPTNHSFPAGDFLHGNVSGKIVPAIAFSWTGGAPTDSAIYAKSQYVTRFGAALSLENSPPITASKACMPRGSVSMTIPADAGPAGGRRKLTLYLGAWNSTARLTVSSPGQAAVTRAVDASQELHPRRG
jgi:hypothetical protein